MKSAQLFSEVSSSSPNTGLYYYSVRSLVSNYIQYRQVHYHTVNIAGGEMTYHALFKGIYGQPLVKFS